MDLAKLIDPRKMLKRARQAVYLASHPLDHHRCASAVLESGLARHPATSLKYVGDHLALSLTASQRRHALIGHYSVLPKLLRSECRQVLRQGALIWRKDTGAGLPPLEISLGPSQLAPMEGELQLSFSFRSVLFALTFTVAPAEVFGVEGEHVLFIGGMQGKIGAREEVREAARTNDEISPPTMLLIAVQAIARAMKVDAIIAVGEDEHVSLGFAREKIAFDYRNHWRSAGGTRAGRHYQLPFDSPKRPLSEVPLSHRSRARRRRESKAMIQRSIEQRLEELFERSDEVQSDQDLAPRSNGKGPDSSAASRLSGTATPSGAQRTRGILVHCD